MPADTAACDDWRLYNYAFGEPRASGTIRGRCEDFQVDEIPAVTADGEGEHLLLHVRKTGANTEWVAARLAESLGVARREISFAGRKDRHAICTQWFSARVVGEVPAGWQDSLPGDVEVLSANRHRRKLRRGTLAGNRFTIVVRDLAGEVETLTSRIAHVRAEGVPNFFGEQRFGRGGSNLVGARRYFQQPRARLPRARREMFLSAARAQVFNALLAQRMADASWNQLLPGEMAMLDGSRSVFSVADVDPTLRSRCASLDIHPSGPLWGRGVAASKSTALQLEQAVATRYSELTRGLEAAGLEHARRALRVAVRDLEADMADGILTLRFSLAPGSYATAVLREILNYQVAPVAAGECA